MKNRMLVVMLLVLAVTAGANAAVYDWIGGDGDWDNPANWFTDSASWTAPHEEHGYGDYSNQDTILINIPAGVNVTRSIGTSIDGMRDGSTTAVLDLYGNLTINGTLWLADWNDTAHGSAIVRNGATLTTTSDLDFANDNNGRLDVEAGGTVNAGDDLLVKSGHGTGTWDGQINVTDDIMLGTGSGTSDITIGTNADINVGDTFYIADGSGAGTNIVNMLGGTMDTGRIIVGDDGGSGFLTMESGAITNTGNLHVAWVGGVDGTYTQNEGTSVHGGTIYLGNAADALPIINLNGGLLQGEDLVFNATNGKIIFTDGWGKLKINGSAVSETDMQGFITSGNIDVSALFGYTISTDGDYTVLTPVPGTAGVVAPLPGASGVAVETILEWLSPEAYVQSGFRVYFGDDPNEQSPYWYANNEIVSGDNVNEIDPAGDLEYDTTYYWRVDALEPNTLGTGFIVHEGMLWNFTTLPALPVVTAGPLNQTVAIGATAIFTVSGTGQTSYEWYKSDDPVNNTPGDDELVATTEDLTLTDVQPDQEGFYYCILINDAGATPTNTAHLMTERIVAQWNFDGNLFDSEDDHDGQPFGGEPNFAPGMIDDALQSYADGEAVTVAYDYELNTDSFSVATWAQVTGSQGVYRTPVSNRDGSPARGFIIYATSGDKWEFWTGPGWDGLGSGDAVTDVVPGEWVHIVGTFQATEILPNDSSTGVKKLYVNGALAAEATDVSYQKNSRRDLLIGAGANEDPEHNYFFDGLLDDTRLYSYAMDRYEVGELFAAGKGEGACVDRPLGDFSGDCLMGLADIALLLTEWLDCGWHPSAGCP